jgi:hypothetical protein
VPVRREGPDAEGGGGLGSLTDMAVIGAGPTKNPGRIVGGRCRRAVPGCGGTVMSASARARANASGSADRRLRPTGELRSRGRRGGTDVPVGAAARAAAVGRRVMHGGRVTAIVTDVTGVATGGTHQHQSRQAAEQLLHRDPRRTRGPDRGEVRQRRRLGGGVGPRLNRTRGLPCPASTSSPRDARFLGNRPTGSP